jgi:hypothetical protein
VHNKIGVRRIRRIWDWRVQRGAEGPTYMLSAGPRRNSRKCGLVMACSLCQKWVTCAPIFAIRGQTQELVKQGSAPTEDGAQVSDPELPYFRHGLLGKD